MVRKIYLEEKLKNKHFTNMIVVEGGSYDVTGVLESARCYLKNLQVFRIEEDMNNNQFIIKFGIVNQHKLKIADYLLNKYPEIKNIKHYFCPNGLLGFRVGSIELDQKNRELHKIWIEDNSLQAYEISAYIQNIQLVEKGYTFKQNNYYLINEEDKKNKIELEKEFNEWLAEFYGLLCLNKQREEYFEYNPLYGMSNDVSLEGEIEWELELRLGIRLCLARAGIHTVKDLISLTPEELLNIRNISNKRFDIIIQTLEAHGLHLKK